MQKNHALWVLSCFLLAFLSGCESYVVNEGEDDVRGEPKERYVVTKPLSPAVDNGNTQTFVDPSSQSLARMSFDSPRSMVAYAFWDPYRNNPGTTAGKSILTTPGNAEIVALGRVRIGNQQGMIEFNFDLPWGQLVAIPVTADSVEITARLVSPVVIGSGVNYQGFNDPPALVLAPGDTLPNPSHAFPTGFVAITGGIGTGSAGPTGACPPTRSALIPQIGAGVSVLAVPIAYGARRVTVYGDPLLANTLAVAGVTVQINTPGTQYNVPLNTKVDLPPNATSVTLVNLAVGATPTGFAVVYELGI